VRGRIEQVPATCLQILRGKSFGKQLVRSTTPI
jgi:hypothetical protein